MKKYIIKKIHVLSNGFVTIDYDFIITDNEGKEISHTSEENYPKGNFVLNLWGDEIVENEKGRRIDITVEKDHRLWGVKID